MSCHPEWQWNECQHVGTDFSDVAEVERYDARMGAFRNVAAENAGILTALALPEKASVLEIGTGTGQFARAAARAGHSVTAVDISPMMLAYAKKCAEAEQLDIHFVQAGFLSMDLPAASFDAVVSVVALHHLPEVWQYLALCRIRKVLKPGGVLYLRDVVFSGNEFPANCEAFVMSCPEEMRPNAVGHVAREFSTFDWVMDGMLERAGFSVISKQMEGPSFFAYRCRCAGDDMSSKGCDA